ncbi:hypothetical protein [Geodermatophilus marinus]|uniref:hypothetical protein n=1 Tax=Geodermatophilus sp. LHW52908 TaxID=2303986 RepID=UPI000E3ED22E|nr:hypothetical protein [Geodermatophilus sp. LHW52908]RFU20336.1 hypothetical protein D0Z06_16870 [Geodermatophilus sp. LHW52908]
MLALTPAPLQTAGERALFAELARWDTGGAVRGAVVASIPVVDGPMERRLSDAVLFVPEGVAVVRVVEVVRQRGVVTALPDGAWTIGAGAGPGDVLQLSGGGSTPLDGLMRAGMDAAVRLRRAGLEPGRIARLTVLVGEITGLHPADGDLGEGDQVALLDPRSLLLGIARSGRYAGVDNPRLWTTADVRAALEALGLAGRVPTVQELNGEGFPYSPYVLRTPDLLAPAAMAASRPAAPGEDPGGAVPPAVAVAPPVPPAVAVAPPVAPVPSPGAWTPARPAPAGWGTPQQPHSPLPQQPGPAWPAPAGRPLVDPAAAAAVAAAAIRADEEAAARAAAAPVTPAPVLPPAPAARDTLVGPTVGVTPEETGGIGGLFAGGERDTDQDDVPPPAPVGPVPFEPVPVEPAPPGVGSPVASAPPAHHGGALVGRRPRPARRTAVLLAAALALVAVLGAGGALLLSGGDDDVAAARGGTTTSAATGAPEPVVDTGPRPGDREVVDGLTLVTREVQVADTCVGNSYGAVAEFFASSDCAGLARALWSTEVGGRPVVVSVSAVDMGDAASARALRALTDQSGTGNVSDLLREGVRYEGGPEALSRAEYASAVSGATVTIVETSWVDPARAGSTADLDVVAGTSLVLPMPDPGA